MTVSLALGGEGLGAAWGEEKGLELLAEAGFENVGIRQLPHDIVNNYYIAQKRRPGDALRLRLTINRCSIPV
jgi:hypothetical protein